MRESGGTVACAPSVLGLEEGLVFRGFLEGGLGFSKGLGDSWKEV